jgi:hypothetical protein
MINNEHMRKTDEFMQAFATTCEDRRVPMPEIREVRVTERNGRVYALAIFPQQFGHKLEVYKDQRFRAQLSSTLGGLKVTYSNSTGFRLAVILEDNSPIGEARLLDLSEQPGPWHVPIGDLLDGKKLWLSIIEMDSVLVGGSRRMGKTRLLHGWIQALSNTGQTLLYLWDGKPNCIEFGRYADRAGVTVIGAQNLADGVRELSEIMMQRAALLAQAGVVDFQSYNAQVTELQPVVFIVDELAAISLLPGADDILRTIEDLISRGGAFGIYPVLATQRPTANAVRGVSKTNLQTRISLPVPSHTDSQIILERVGAEKLPKIKGRLAIVWEANLIEAQAYRIDLPESGEQVIDEQSGVVDNQVDKQMTERDRELAERCMNENSGLFTLTWLSTIGMGQGEARTLQTEWAARSWIVKDRNRSNAYVVTSTLTGGL